MANRSERNGENHILLTGRHGLTQEHLSYLRGAGMEISVLEDESKAVARSDQAANYIVCNSLFQHSNKLEDFPHLRRVQLRSAGWDRFPLEAARRLGIEVFNAQGVYSVPIAEWVITRILDLYKCVPEYLNLQSRHSWQKLRRERELNGKVVCIVGIGGIARALQPRLAALGARVTGVSRRASLHVPGFETISHVDALGAAVQRADVVVCCLPSSVETKGIFRERLFREFKQDAIFINVSRGDLVDQGALVNALRRGDLAGAALDVFAEEPLQEDDRIWSAPNAILTPHVAFESDGNSKRFFSLLLQNFEIDA